MGRLEIFASKQEKGLGPYETCPLADSAPCKFQIS